MGSIPLRLALTDHPEDAESNEALGRDSPSDLRLARKLLIEKRDGQQSQWWPFIQILPESIFSPYGEWSHAATEQLQFPLAKNLFLVAENQAKNSLMEGFSHQDISWALSIVHSRSFMTAGQGESQGVRMLLPLADLFNHSGLINFDFPFQDSVPTHNVEWNLNSPEEGIGWSFQFKAAENIEEGSEATISYGNHSSQAFLLHYGFLPEQNASDTVILFQDLKEAVEWYLDRFPPQGITRDLGNKAIKIGQGASAILPKNLQQDPIAKAQQDNLLITAQGKIDARLIDSITFLIEKDKETSSKTSPSHKVSSEEEFGNSLPGITEDSKNPSDVNLSPKKAQRVIALRIMELLNLPQVSSLLTDLGLLAVANFLEPEEKDHYVTLLEYYAKVKKTFEEKYSDFIMLAGLTAKGQNNDSEIIEQSAGEFDEPSIQSLLWRTSQKQILWTCMIALMA